jgi:predicted nuclease of predicted toxin-antitoxin system
VAKFLVDEDLPRSLARELRQAGIDAIDARDAGLRGRPDREILAFAVSEGRAVLTGDLGFANVLAFPPSSHHGVVVARFPSQTPVRALNDAVLAAARSLTDDEIEQAIVIVEPGRIRLRRRPSPHE